MLYLKKKMRRFRWRVEPQCYSGLCIYMHRSSQCAAVCISCLEATLRFCVSWLSDSFSLLFFWQLCRDFLPQCARIVWGEGGSRRVCDNEQVVLCIAFAKTIIGKETKKPTFCLIDSVVTVSAKNLGRRFSITDKYSSYISDGWTRSFGYLF